MVDEQKLAGMISGLKKHQSPKETPRIVLLQERVVVIDAGRVLNCLERLVRVGEVGLRVCGVVEGAQLKVGNHRIHDRRPRQDVDPVRALEHRTF